MQSACLNSDGPRNSEPLSAPEAALSKRAVERPTWVSDLRKQSLIREIYIAKRPTNSASKQFTNGRSRAPEVYRSDISTRTLHPSRQRLITDKNFCLDSIG
jgi:hypothetical protein